MTTLSRAQSLNVALATARVLTTQLEACVQGLPFGPQRDDLLDMKTTVATYAESLADYAKHAERHVELAPSKPAFLTEADLRDCLNFLNRIYLDTH